MDGFAPSPALTPRCVALPPTEPRDRAARASVLGKPWSLMPSASVSLSEKLEIIVPCASQSCCEHPGVPWGESSGKWEMSSWTLSGARRHREECPSTGQLLFIASQIRQDCKGTSTARGPGNPSSKSPPKPQRNPRTCVHPGTQTWMVGEEQDNQALSPGVPRLTEGEGSLRPMGDMRKVGLG